MEHHRKKFGLRVPSPSISIPHRMLRRSHNLVTRTEVKRAEKKETNSKQLIR
jgi:hypothetical protein